MDFIDDCPLCNPERDPNQHVVLENEGCRFLQHDREQDVLKGSGLIVPRQHREDVFALAESEWRDTSDLLQRTRAHIDAVWSPHGYTVGWNSAPSPIRQYSMRTCT